jgi:hypothetical protein
LIKKPYNAVYAPVHGSGDAVAKKIIGGGWMVVLPFDGSGQIRTQESCS